MPAHPTRTLLPCAKMAFSIKRRGKVTYDFECERPVLSARGVLGLDELVTMDPLREVALVFRCWEKWVRDAGICESLADVDFLEVHAFGCQPKTPNPLVDPAGYAAELARLRTAYREAYSAFFADNLPDNGLPARFTVHVVDVPDQAASYEFYATALLQRARQSETAS